MSSRDVLCGNINSVGIKDEHKQTYVLNKDASLC